MEPNLVQGGARLSGRKEQSDELGTDDELKPDKELERDEELVPEKELVPEEEFGSDEDLELSTGPRPECKGRPCEER